MVNCDQHSRLYIGMAGQGRITDKADQAAASPGPAKTWQPGSRQLEKKEEF